MKPKKISFRVTLDVLPDHVVVEKLAKSLQAVLESIPGVKAKVTRLRKPRTVHRSAVSGEFISKAKAKKRPGTTTKEKR